VEGLGRLSDPEPPRQLDVTCRACGSRDLTLILSLGEQPLANALRPLAEIDAEQPRYPLDLAHCTTCSLVQLTVSVDPDEMFADYPYFSSYSDTVVRNAADLVEQMVADLGLGAESLAMEIASNDGYLLRHYRDAGVPVLGIDPAANVVAVATADGIRTRCAYFGNALARELRTEGIRASVLHANNVMAHVPDVRGVVQGITTVLADDGVFVMETPYVRDLVEAVEFDTIYHEHLAYYSVTSLDRLFGANGLELVGVERIPIHGGSLRAFGALPGARERTPDVARLLDEEANLGLDDVGYYRDFSARVDALCASLRERLDALREGGTRIAGYGAAAKATVLLNALGVDADTIEFVVDRNPNKQERLVPGTRIPIRAPEALLTDRPDVTVLFSWNFADEVLAQQAEYRAGGGRFLIPIPEIQLV